MEATRSARRTGRKIALAGLLTGAEIGVSSRKAHPGRPGTPVGVTTVDGVRLAVDVDECASPELAVVFAHGWVLDRRSWRFQRRALAGTATMVFYDQRGHGGSAPGAEETRTVDRLGDDLAAVIEQTVPVGVPVVVVGHSMGGMTVMSLAARRPELFGTRIVGAALLSPSCGRLNESAHRPPRRGTGAPPEPTARRLAPVIPLRLNRPEPDGLGLDGLDGLDGLGADGLGGGWSSGGRTGGHARRRARPATTGACSLPDTHVAPETHPAPGTRTAPAARAPDARCLAFGPRAKRDHIRFVNERVEATPTEMMVGYSHELLLREDPAVLAALRAVRTVIMVGSGDRLTPPIHSRRIADLLPDAVLTVVAGAGHMIALERPDVVNRTLSGFLTHVARRRPNGVRFG